MNNIIANLRRDRPLSWENRLEAADEIFRLREENARLRADLADQRLVSRDNLDWFSSLKTEYDALREENARLREERDLLHAILTNVSLSMEAFDVNAAICEGGKEDDKNN